MFKVISMPFDSFNGYGMYNGTYVHLSMHVQFCLFLFFSDNSMVTDISLKALGKACRNLECVSIAGCSRVTDHGLKGLHSLKSLISLNVADCVR